MKQLLIFLSIFFALISNTAPSKTVKELIKKIKREPEYVSLYDLKAFELEESAEMCQEITKLINDKKVETVLKLGLIKILSDYKEKESVEEVSKILSKTAKCDPLLVKMAAERKAKSNIYSHNLTSTNQMSIYWALKGIICTKRYLSSDCTKVYNLMSDKYPLKIRILAVEAISGYPTERSIQTLLRQLHTEELNEKIQKTLARLTGLPTATTKEEWYKLLSREKRKELSKMLKYRPVPKKELNTEELQKKAEADKKFDRQLQANFYGLEVEGDNIIFILDRSGSMTDLMDTLKQNLYHVLENMKKDSKVSFVFFGSPLVEAYPKKGLTLATTSRLKKIKTFIQEVNASGGTPMGKAIMHCFEEVASGNKIDTIYLLSDGVPQNREIIKPLLEYYNTTFEIPIHTVSLGRDSDLLENIAKDNSGKYIRVD